MKLLQVQVSLVFASCLLAFAVATTFVNCGSQATISVVSVSGCDGQGECILKRNTNVSIGLEFTTEIEVSEITTVVHGIVMDVPVPFPIPNPDACTSGALKCPILPNVQSSYLTELAVLKSYPRVKVDVKWQLQSEKGVDIVCILIPVKIQ